MSPDCHILIWGISICFMSHSHFRDDFLLYVVSGFLIPYCIGLSLNFSSWTEFLKGRHLDNLLLRDDGRLFHVDFGYILGRDPKPFPPPMKLCKEMVEAMGGAESQYYTRFKSYCCEAYNILRKSSNLILNLFHLMAGSNIPDIASDPEKGILKLQEKFRLDLDDEACVHFFQDLINESVSALFPQMVETIHRWAQYWRWSQNQIRCLV